MIAPWLTLLCQTMDWLEALLRNVSPLVPWMSAYVGEFLCDMPPQFVNQFWRRVLPTSIDVAPLLNRLLEDQEATLLAKKPW
jgi:hypothetical protein